jgi:hypothetical protein
MSDAKSQKISYFYHPKQTELLTAAAEIIVMVPLVKNQLIMGRGRKNYSYTRKDAYSL